ncbi:MAG: S41 family peptidase [Bacteroidaceae bacterium]|nr:S41 family peptidase [Bacteroidaceae bacterium]
MKKHLYILTFVIPLLLFSCVKEEQHSSDPKGCFEALWKIMDEHYCFFDYKQKEYGLDWNEVYRKYEPLFNNQRLSTLQTFELLTSMLAELRDGHVNLSTAFDYGRYWAWKDSYPQNFSDTLLRRYLQKDYQIAASLNYRVLDDNIGYIYCGSFASEAGDGNFDAVFSLLATCNALIVDVRNNGGGLISAAEKFAAHFTNEELLVGYFQHKTGPGHNDFSSLDPQYLKPSSGMRWQKKVAVLTNRSVFSAANEFVKYMKCCPNVVVIGDKTGGGGGMPLSSELPNGWFVRFSACPMYDKDKNPTEFGIDPDIKIDITSEDFNKSIDTIIEEARRQLSK